MAKYSVTKKIKREFAKKDTLTLDEIHSILSQDKELEYVMPNLRHRIRNNPYGMKKKGDLELIDKATYKIVK